VTINSEQRTKIKQSFSSTQVNRVSSGTHFTISMGSEVPHTVKLAPLPPTIVEIVPQYRSYEYVVVEDDIVIVDPKTMKIVYVIENAA